MQDFRIFSKSKIALLSFKFLQKKVFADLSKKIALERFSVQSFWEKFINNLAW
jgi:hypothetical protein